MERKKYSPDNEGIRFSSMLVRLHTWAFLLAKSKNIVVSSGSRRKRHRILNGNGIAKCGSLLLI